MFSIDIRKGYNHRELFCVSLTQAALGYVISKISWFWFWAHTRKSVMLIWRFEVEVWSWGMKFLIPVFWFMYCIILWFRVEGNVRKLNRKEHYLFFYYFLPYSAVDVCLISCMLLNLSECDNQVLKVIWWRLDSYPLRYLRQFITVPAILWVSVFTRSSFWSFCFLKTVL